MAANHIRRDRYPVKLDRLDRHFNRYVNVVGVVVEFSFPRPSVGTDFVTTLKIIDDSPHQPEIGASIFMQSVDQLPHIQSHKDIIVLLNVRIKNYNQRPYVVFNKKSSSFALFDGKDYKHGEPYQTSPAFGSAGPLQTYPVMLLTTWNKGFSFDAGISNYVVQMKDVKAGYIDIVCKILHACEMEETGWILYVWDGTDAPTISLKSEGGDNISNQLALHIEPRPLPADVLCRFPCLGTVLRVVVDKCYGNLRAYFNSFDTWVSIRNLEIVLHPSGLWMGSLTDRSKIRLLTVDDNSVKERVRNHEDRIGESRRPANSLNISDFLTVTNHRGCYVTLMDLLTLTQSDGLFKCIVRFASVYPYQPHLWLDSGNRYSMLMTLEDPTARIHALLCHEDAEVLFGGHPALDIVSTKVKKLLGMVDGGLRNPPWTEVCISLFLPKKGDPSGRKQFHLCHTSFACRS